MNFSFEAVKAAATQGFQFAVMQQPAHNVARYSANTVRALIAVSVIVELFGAAKQAWADHSANKTARVEWDKAHPAPVVDKAASSVEKTEKAEEKPAVEKFVGKAVVYPALKRVALSFLGTGLLTIKNSVSKWNAGSEVEGKVKAKKA